MINSYLSVGGVLITGPTFSVLRDQVDDLDIFISNRGSLSSQAINITMQNEFEQTCIEQEIGVNFSNAVTVSLIFQSSLDTDISTDLNTSLGVKSVVLELIP